MGWMDEEYEDPYTTGITNALRRRAGIPVPPKPKPKPKTTPSTTTSGSTGSTGTGKTGATGTGTGTSSKTSDPYSSYLKKQKAAERKASSKASARYVAQAQLLNPQARSLRRLLGLSVENIPKGGVIKQNLLDDEKLKNGKLIQTGPSDDGKTVKTKTKTKVETKSKSDRSAMDSLLRGSDSKRPAPPSVTKNGGPRNPKHPNHPKNKGGGKGPELKLGPAKHEGDLKDRLNTTIANLKESFKSGDALLMEGFRDSTEGFAKLAQSNDDAAADQTFAAMSNRGRERANALSEATLQGAGESDMLRTQLMSLRNWNANQSEVERSHADSLASINSSLLDLYTDTKKARQSQADQYDADRGQAWDNYFQSSSEAMTQLSNTYGEMATNYMMANEQKKSKKNRRKIRKYKQLSAQAANAASTFAAQKWSSPGDHSEITEWEKPADLASTRGGSTYHPGMYAIQAPKAPEGASLRKWST